MHPLIPLVILVVVLLGAAVVGFVVYTIATDIATKTSKKMEDHNVSFGKDGVKIGLREMKHEDYVGRTQNVLVQAWNLSTWPAYKSRFWNKKQDAGSSSSGGAGSSGSGKSRSGSNPRQPSPGPRRPTSSSSGTHSSQRVHAVSHRTENGHLAEPRPIMRRSASNSSIPGSFD